MFKAGSHDSAGAVASWIAPGQESTVSARVDAVIRRVLRPAPLSAWAIGTYDQRGDLDRFVLSAPHLSRTTAFEALCGIPLPDVADGVVLRVTGDNGKSADCIGVAAAAGEGRSVVFVAFRPLTASDKTWAQVGRGMQHAARRLAQAVSAEPASTMATFPQPSRERSCACFVLTRDFSVALQWWPPGSDAAELAGLTESKLERLPTILENSIRRLTATWDFSRAKTCLPATANPIPGLAVRVVPMRGAGVLIGVFLEPQSGFNPAQYAAACYRLSARECDVVSALLDGDSIAEIAASLSLAESTVNDHIARLMAKTNSRNRIQMAATLLGWPSARSGPRPHAMPAASESVVAPSERERSHTPPVAWRYSIGIPAADADD